MPAVTLAVSESLWIHSTYIISSKDPKTFPEVLKYTGITTQQQYLKWNHCWNLRMMMTSINIPSEDGNCFKAPDLLTEWFLCQPPHVLEGNHLCLSSFMHIYEQLFQGAALSEERITVCCH